MNQAAIDYVMELEKFADGAPIKANHKIVGFVLAAYYDQQARATWPSLETIAEKSCMSRSTAIQTLDEMEKHLLIRRVELANQDQRGFTVYRLVGLDEPASPARNRCHASGR
jgi:hypothetical protein